MIDITYLDGAKQEKSHAFLIPMKSLNAPNRLA